MMRIGPAILATLFLLLTIGESQARKADRVVVVKSTAKLYLLDHGTRFQEIHVAFGGNPVGHKRQEGDERTPEGDYFLDYKNANSAFYKSIHISYPNAKDKARATALGVSPGGQIMIHGQLNHFGWLSFISQRFNWTDGCIAVSNSDMDQIWASVEAGTPITIEP